MLQVRPFGERWQRVRFVRLRRGGRFHFAWYKPDLFEGGWLRLIVRRRGSRDMVLWLREVGPDLVPPPDMLRNYRLHIFFWTPPGTALQEGVIDGVPRFERDIQASLASGARSNIFAIPRSYTGPGGPGDPRIASISVSGRSDPIPADPSFASSCARISGPCATADQVASEIEAIGRDEGWGREGQDLVLLFTGSPLAVCMEAGCELISEPCGYHSITKMGRVYATVLMSAAEGSRCAGGGPPDIEFARDLIGHEQNEAVVDPGLEGIEIADPCQGHFLRQFINGTQYIVPELLRYGICASTDE